MNYDETTVRVLAERFVLGTMSRRARRRFSRLVDEDVNAAQAVWDHEAQLLPLAWSLEPVQPSDLVWQRISRLMQTRSESSARRAPPWLAAAMTAAFIAAAIGWYQESTRPPETVIETVVETVTEPVPLEPAVGIIENADNDALWVARIYSDLNRVDIQVRTLPEEKTQNDYQLWLLPDDGVPVSVGLLPQEGERTLLLDDAAMDALTRSETLAVSLEPLGGSPEAVPTGPVLFTAALLAP